jgi:hypothetical protein
MVGGMDLWQPCHTVAEVQSARNGTRYTGADDTMPDVHERSPWPGIRYEPKARNKAD